MRGAGPSCPVGTGTCCSRPPEVAIPLVACHDCDLLQRLPPLPEGGRASCPRCGSTLRKRPHEGLERTLALTLAAAVLFVVANSFPFLSFEMRGSITQTTLVSGVIDLYRQGKQELAALVLLTTVLAPMFQMLLLLHLLVPLRWNRIPWQLQRAFRLLRHAQVWSMMEVFMIGILVALVKLMGMATIVAGLALWSFVLLMLVLAGAVASFDPEEMWERVEALR
jgi:paraquat-inducible protein A